MPPLMSLSTLQATDAALSNNDIMASLKRLRDTMTRAIIFIDRLKDAHLLLTTLVSLSESHSQNVLDPELQSLRAKNAKIDTAWNAVAGLDSCQALRAIMMNERNARDTAEKNVLRQQKRIEERIKCAKDLYCLISLAQIEVQKRYDDDAEEAKRVREYCNESFA